MEQRRLAILTRCQRDVWELYDLQNDPMEMHNIYNEPGNESLIDSLKTELRKLQEQYDDPIETELANARK